MIKKSGCIHVFFPLLFTCVFLLSSPLSFYINGTLRCTTIHTRPFSPCIALNDDAHCACVFENKTTLCQQQRKIFYNFLSKQKSKILFPTISEHTLIYIPASLPPPKKKIEFSNIWKETSKAHTHVLYQKEKKREANMAA